MKIKKIGQRKLDRQLKILKFSFQEHVARFGGGVMFSIVSVSQSVCHSIYLLTVHDRPVGSLPPTEGLLVIVFTHVASLVGKQPISTASSLYTAVPLHCPL